MKKYLLIIAAAFLLLTACTQETIKPPDLDVSSEDGMITAVTGTYGWTENSENIQADSDTPPNIVEFQEDELIVSQGEVLNLAFKKAPEDVQVNIWNNDEVVKQELDDNKLVVPNELGEVIYEVVAEYEEGTVHYAFEVTVEN